ncbi:MAG: hypothetical protein R2736_18655 [Solirubrobacterales bacterium]
MAGSVAAFLALWGIVYLTVRDDSSLASAPSAESGQTSQASSDDDSATGAAPSAAAPAPSQGQLPPASTGQS